MIYEDVTPVVGRFFFRYRSYLPVAVYLAMLFLPRIPFPRPALLWAAGAACVASGIWLRLWAIRHIGKRARTRSDKARFLIETGPFAMNRNPLYVANLATGCGFCFAFELAWYVPVYLFIMGGFYSFVVRYEEDFLIKKFGAAYTAYAARVPRWLPDIKRHRIGTGGTFQWGEVLRWERSFVVIVILGVAAAAARRMFT